MPIELKIPSAGESITEVILSEWLKAEGELAERDEALALIETDKANVEVLAPARGVITKMLRGEGELARVGEVIALFEAQDTAAPKIEAPAATPPAPPAATQAAPPPPAAEAPKPPTTKPAAPQHGGTLGDDGPRRTSPSYRRAQREAEQRGVAPAPSPAPVSSPAPAPQPVAQPVTPPQATLVQAPPMVEGRLDEIAPMSPLRKRVAARLVEAQQTTAMLTTFNEVDMSAVMALRKTHQDAFRAKHGVKLGFMSFFVKAAVEALRAFPAVNAEIRGTDIVYHKYYDIGVAVGSGKGLVVPIIRDAEALSFAEIERVIADFGERAQASRLKVEELQGGTFTVSNGGIYGSMMSTPILNPPQSGILGMHAIQDRPVVRGGAVTVAPMMYLALTYDHRIIDGREAVSFLVRIKECIESPARMLLEV